MKQLIIAIAALLLVSAGLRAQEVISSDKDSLLITIFLKHQQDKNLDSLQKIQAQHQFAAMFPPKSARVISWYVMMGIGQVVTLKIQAGDLRTLNLSIEKGAWGAFKTEFYPTYDYVPVWKESMKKQP